MLSLSPQITKKQIRYDQVWSASNQNAAILKMQHSDWWRLLESKPWLRFRYEDIVCKFKRLSLWPLPLVHRPHGWTPWQLLCWRSNRQSRDAPPPTGPRLFGRDSPTSNSLLTQTATTDRQIRNSQKQIESICVKCPSSIHRRNRRFYLKWDFFKKIDITLKRYEME